MPRPALSRTVAQLDAERVLATLDQALAAVSHRATLRLGFSRLAAIAVCSEPCDLPGPVDAALVSHEAHPDSLDERGRAVVKDSPAVGLSPGPAAPCRGRTAAVT